MADATGKVKIEVTAEDKASRVVEGARSKIVADAKRMAAGFAGAYVSVQAFNAIVTDSIRISLEHQRVTAQASRAFGSQTKQLDAWSEAMQRTTGISSDAILMQAGITKQLSGSTVQAQKFTRAAIEAGTALGRDWMSIQQQLNKSLSGMSGELGELVPDVRALTAEQLKAGGAADLLLKKFGGSAEAEAGTLYGSISRVREAWRDLKQEFGDGILGTGGSGSSASMDRLATSLDVVTGAIHRFHNALRNTNGLGGFMFGFGLPGVAVGSAAFGGDKNVNPAISFPQGYGAASGPPAEVGAFAGSSAIWITQMQDLGFSIRELASVIGSGLAEPGVPALPGTGFNPFATPYGGSLSRSTYGRGSIRRRPRGGAMGDWADSFNLGGPVSVPPLQTMSPDEMERLTRLSEQFGSSISGALVNAIRYSEDLGDALKRALLDTVLGAAQGALSGGIAGVITDIFGKKATDPSVQRSVRAQTEATNLARRRGY